MPPDIRLNDREQIQYLLGNPPGWMLRYGLSAIGSVIGLLLFLSYLIQYPDVVEAKVVLTTSKPPIRVLAAASSRVEALLVEHKQGVKKGQTLAVLESAAHWKDVLRLETWLTQSDSMAGPLPAGLQLGDLQSASSIYCEHWKEYQYLVDSAGVEIKIWHIQRQINGLKDVAVNLKKQQIAQAAGFSLAEKGFHRQRLLHRNGVISDLEFENAESEYLQQRMQQEQTEAALIQNKMEMRRQESQIAELEQQDKDQRNDKQRLIEEDRQRLRSAVQEWKLRYLVVAPIDGNVSLFTIWSAQQAVASGDEVLAVVPPSETAGEGARIIGKAALPAPNSGKVKPGMRALIQLDGFPAQQYGALEAQVGNIALIPQKQEYLFDLELPALMKSTYNKNIPFRQEMSGTVRIITENQRIINRIFNHFEDLLRNR